MYMTRPRGCRHIASNLPLAVYFCLVTFSFTAVHALLLLQRPFHLEGLCLGEKVPYSSSTVNMLPRRSSSIVASRLSTTCLHSISTTVPLSSSPPSSSSSSPSYFPSIRGSASEIILPDGRVLSFNFRPRSWLSRLLAYTAAALLAVGRRAFLPFSPKWRWHFKALNSVAHPLLTRRVVALLFIMLEAYVYMVPLRQLQLQLFFRPTNVPAEMLKLPASRFVPVSMRGSSSSSNSSSSGSNSSSSSSNSSSSSSYNSSGSNSISMSSSSSFSTASSPSPPEKAEREEKGHAPSLIKLHALVHQHQPSPSSSSFPPKRIIIHCNHGFGANSLSFEPVLESLAGALGQSFPTLAVAHDAPGFGLTDSPADEDENEGGREEGGLYTFESNARLGGRLMGELRKEGGREGGREEAVYIGHSMGSLTSAYMALHTLERQDREGGRQEAVEKGHAPPSSLPPPVILILIAPAIIPMRRAPSRLPPAGRAFLPRLFPERLLRSLFQTHKTGPALHALLLLLTSSFLRSLCYSEKFWREGLGVAWGKGGPPSALTLAHYRLPGLKEGWERGLSRFVLAPLFAPRKEKGREDVVETLGRRVREGRLRVMIMHGTQDRVVSIANTRRLAAAMGEGVEVMEVEGVGHVPHEEVPETFVQAVGEFIRREGRREERGGVTIAI